MPEPRPSGYLDWAESFLENPEALLNLRQRHHQLPTTPADDPPQPARERRAGQIATAGEQLEALSTDVDVPVRLRQLLNLPPEAGVLERLDLIAGMTWSQTSLWRRRCLQRGAVHVLERYPQAALLEAPVLELLANEARTGGRRAGLRAEVRELVQFACLLLLLVASVLMAAGVRSAFRSTLEALSNA